MVRWSMQAWLAVAVCVMGCGGTVVAPVPTTTATPTVLPTATPAPGANITFIGLASPSDVLIEPASIDSQGRAVYEFRFGSSFELVIEGRPGSNHKAVGLSTFNYDPLDPTVRPDLQVIVSRPLGDGSAAVCDNSPPIGGVPAVDPPDFSETQAISDALNDLGCRFNDGTGNPSGRSNPLDACTQFSDGEFHFAAPDTTVQFCGRIAVPFSFPAGETVVTARLRDVSGAVGPSRQMVVRINPSTTPPATRPQIPTDTPTPTPTPLPPPGGDGFITFFGITAANDVLIPPIGADSDGRLIYEQQFSRGFNLIVEARPLANNKPIGVTAYAYDPLDPTLRPDLQILLSRQLGDGSPDVCDNAVPALGGVPAVDPPDFSITPQISGAINDLGCRFNDGTGNPSGRSNPVDACTVFTDGTFHFVDSTTTVQFCAPIVAAIRFLPGDTIVSARVRNGPVRQIVVRISG